MGNVNLPDDFVSRVAKLEADLAELRKNSGLRNAVITQGGLTVKDDTGNTLFQVGDFEAGGEPALGFAAFRPDGTTQFWGYTLKDGSGGFWGGWDQSGNTIVSEDGVSGQGLATPYIPVPFVDADSVVPAVTTTSASFTPVQLAIWLKQHPRLFVRLIVRSSAAATTGEVRMTVGGVQYGATIPVAANDWLYKEIGPIAVPGGHLSTNEVLIEARRTGGAGTIGARVINAWGMQS